MTPTAQEKPDRPERAPSPERAFIDALEAGDVAGDILIEQDGRLAPYHNPESLPEELRRLRARQPRGS